ncbi:MAG: hypothetical protein GF408_04160 [Candidatus Omnitrophica bacterium]|nr:hypothetical protein [Candidatus Omnitrophota bacterium]
MDRKRVFHMVLGIWTLLWLFFLVRPDKDGQYGELAYFYSHGYESRVESLLGSGLYEYLRFCRQNLPAGSTYRLEGLGELSVRRVRARYYLWPLRMVGDDPDFIMVYGDTGRKFPGYRFYLLDEGRGSVYRKEGGE